MAHELDQYFMVFLAKYLHYPYTIPCVLQGYLKLEPLNKKRLKFKETKTLFNQIIDHTKKHIRG